MHAYAAGDHREWLESLSWLPLVVWAGRMPVEAGILRCRDALAQRRRRPQGDVGRSLQLGEPRLRRCAGARRRGSARAARPSRRAGAPSGSRGRSCRTRSPARSASGSRRAGRPWRRGRVTDRHGRAALPRQPLRGTSRRPSTSKADTRRSRRIIQSGGRDSPAVTTPIRKACCDASGRRSLPAKGTPSRRSESPERP